MTRIIAGRAGGRTLRTPPGAGTRPTSDRVREALFSALDARGVVAGAAVLDLYAGSGALGLEAASRGARSVDLVESDRRAASVISANAEGLGLPDVRLRVRAMTVTHHLAGSDTAYDLVFVDPPFDADRFDAALARCSGDPDCVIDSIHTALYDHTHARTRADDQTLVAIRYQGGAG